MSISGLGIYSNSGHFLPDSLIHIIIIKWSSVYSWKKKHLVLFLMMSYHPKKTVFQPSGDFANNHLQQSRNPQAWIQRTSSNNEDEVDNKLIPTLLQLQYLSLTTQDLLLMFQYLVTFENSPFLIFMYFWTRPSSVLHLFFFLIQTFISFNLQFS